MASNAERVEALRFAANKATGANINLTPMFAHEIADALERCEASLATCERRREALEAENTFLREEISAAAQRLKALAPREDTAGEGL
jgi:FtsZ-binding cell division protein ZapB